MGLDIMEHLPFDRYPNASEMIAKHVVKVGCRTMDEFYNGLDLILDGIVQYEASEKIRSVSK